MSTRERSNDPSQAEAPGPVPWIERWLPRLCAADTTTGSEDRGLPALLELLGELGAEVHLQPVEAGRTNVLATWGEPRVLLTTHLDTVPPFIPPTGSDAGLEGRGACDAKGQIVAQLGAIREFLREAPGDAVDLAWLGVVGEEIDSDGALAALKLKPRLPFLAAVINGEPTGGVPASGQKGFAHLELICRGRRGHSSLADGSSHALWRLLDWLSALRAVPLGEDAWFGDESWNLGVLRGGSACNSTPGEARAEIAARTVPGSSLVERFVASAPQGAEVLVHSEEPAARFSVFEDLPHAPVGFGSDTGCLQCLTEAGDVYLCGPGTIDRAHADDESITWEELRVGVDRLVELCSRLLARPGGAR